MSTAASEHVASIWRAQEESTSLFALSQRLWLAIITGLSSDMKPVPSPGPSRVHEQDSGEEFSQFEGALPQAASPLVGLENG